MINILDVNAWGVKWKRVVPERCNFVFIPAARVRHRWPNDTIRAAALGNSVTKRDFSLEHCPHLSLPLTLAHEPSSSRVRIVRERPYGIAVPLTFCKSYSKLLRRDVLPLYRFETKFHLFVYQETRTFKRLAKKKKKQEKEKEKIVTTT